MTAELPSQARRARPGRSSTRSTRPSRAPKRSGPSCCERVARTRRKCRPALTSRSCPLKEGGYTLTSPQRAASRGAAARTAPQRPRGSRRSPVHELAARSELSMRGPPHQRLPRAAVAPGPQARAAAPARARTPSLGATSGKAAAASLSVCPPWPYGSSAPQPPQPRRRGSCGRRRQQEG